MFSEMMSLYMDMGPPVPRMTPEANPRKGDGREDNASGSDSLWDSVVIRLTGEIGIKSRPVRSRLERTLVTYIRRALEHREILFHAITRSPGRAYVSLRYCSAAGDVLGKVFGISSYSPARMTTSDLNEITSASLQVAQSALARGSTFAVSCRRTGRQNYSSADAQAKVGEAILAGFRDIGVRVNLSQPDVRVGMEVVNETAYVFTKSLPGAGGMPYGSQGRMVAILDGSIRPAVAAWLMMKRGSPIVPLFVGRTSDRTRPPKEVLHQVLTLAGWSPYPTATCYTLWEKEPLVAPTEGRPTDQQALPWVFVHADALSELVGAEGIVVDERLGLGYRDSGVETQPLRTYRCVRPVFMPLLGFDEGEAQNLAEKIGLLTVRGADG